MASERNQDWVRHLGADQTVDYRDPAAMTAIDADIILNFAAPGDTHRQDPLLDLLRRRAPPRPRLREHHQSGAQLGHR